MQENKQIILDLNVQYHNFKFFSELDGEDTYSKLAQIIPWQEIECLFSKTENELGRTPLNSRVQVGALIIQNMENLTDRKLVKNIKQNPYYQMFIGLAEFTWNAPFDVSSLVHFRKRVDKISIELNELLANVILKDLEDNIPVDEESVNKGDLIIDATAAPVDITYPADTKLLNDARVKSIEIIDECYKPNSETKKPRTNKLVAIKEYNQFSKLRKKSKKKINNMKRKQLTILRNNLQIINERLSSGMFQLSNKQVEDLAVINEIYDQQNYMYENKTNKVDKRIVSFSQNHIRPIVRGKARASVEFGPKISAHIHQGIAYLDTISFENFNESTILKDVIVNFQTTHGYYPKRVLADRIYQTRENRKYCANLGIRLQGKSLGRKSAMAQEQEKYLAKLDNSDRQVIEGLFGTLKRKYGMNLLLTKLESTQKTSIAMIFFVYNLERYLNKKSNCFSQSIYYLNYNVQF